MSGPAAPWVDVVVRMDIGFYPPMTRDELQELIEAKVGELPIEVFRIAIDE